MSETTTYRNALALGTNLLEYQLELVLGAGGFGMTYLARDTNLEKVVAIKEYLPTDLALRALDGSVVPVNTESEHDYRWGLERFIQEARTLARFSHPNIVRVNRYFEANGTGYMVMDYEEGESLNQHLRREPRPGEDGLKALLAPLLDGLEAVHKVGFLHRDIKPSNIFLRVGGAPVLLDFGSARQASSGTRSLTSVLTPGFAPLEQYASDGNQGPWSDIYAIGAVVYRAITGNNPPDAVTRLKADTVMQALDGARDCYSEDFLNAVKWAMALDETQRPQYIAQWKPALFGGQAAPVTPAPAAPADAATVPLTRRAKPTQPLSSASTRPATMRPPKKSGWRQIGIAAVIVVAIAVAGAWNKQRAAKEMARIEAAGLAAERRGMEQRAAKLDAERKRLDEERNRAADHLRRTEEERRRAAAGATPEPRELRPGPAPRERPGRDRADRPSDLSPGQVQRLQRAAEGDFRAADANSDGYLSRDEVARRFPFAAREFERVDADRDGRISPREFWRLRRAQGERAKNP